MIFQFRIGKGLGKFHFHLILFKTMWYSSCKSWRSYNRIVRILLLLQVSYKSKSSKLLGFTFGYTIANSIPLQIFAWLCWIDFMYETTRLVQMSSAYGNFISALKGRVEKEAVANWSKADFPLTLLTFDRNWWYSITGDSVVLVASESCTIMMSEVKFYIKRSLSQELPYIKLFFIICCTYKVYILLHWCLKHKVKKRKKKEEDLTGSTTLI